MRLNRFTRSSIAWTSIPALCVALTLGAMMTNADDNKSKSSPAKENKTITEKKTVTQTVTETKTVVENGKVVSSTETSSTSTSSQPSESKEKSDLAKNLVGTWVLETAAYASNPSGIGTRLKFFTGTHWSVTQPDKGGEVVFHHGGTYTIEGDTLTENTTFAGESTAENIGNTVKLTMSVDGDSMKQTGIDNPYTETWKRAK